MKRALVLALLLLTSCIEVEHFGAYWSKGVSDPCLAPIVEASILSDAPHHPPLKNIARTLKLGEQRFLMIKKTPSETGGTLFRYRIEGGDYVAYRLNEDKRDQFLREYPDAPVILTGETATIELLDRNAARILETLSADATYWIEVDRHAYNPNKQKNCLD